ASAQPQHGEPASRCAEYACAGQAGFLRERLQRQRRNPMKRRHPPAIDLTGCGAFQPMPAHGPSPTGSALPATTLEGLLSGLAHPVIGVDHFLFVLALGAVVYHFGRRVRNVGAFLAAAWIGTVLHVQQATLPQAELWVGASLVVLGIAVL